MQAVIAMCQSVAHFFIAGVTTKAPNVLMARVIPVNVPISLIDQQSGLFISNRFDTDMLLSGIIATKNAAIRMLSRTRCGPGDRNKRNT